MSALMLSAAVIIPARWESTRFPGKPLHPIAGKPLLQHVWERCREARGIERILVATDDRRIAEAAANFGAEVAMTSPNHLSGTDRIAEAARTLPERYRTILNVQGDEPLIAPELITQLAEALRAEPTLEMITAANVFGDGEEIENPNAVKVVLDATGHALFFSRSAIPNARTRGVVPTYRHLGIYGYEAGFLQRFVHWPPGKLERAEQLEQLRALENGVRVRVLVTAHHSFGVDAPEDVGVIEGKLRGQPTRSFAEPPLA